VKGPSNPPWVGGPAFLKNEYLTRFSVAGAAAGRKREHGSNGT
jgi:hypothetical protein